MKVEPDTKTLLVNIDRRLELIGHRLFNQKVLGRQEEQERILSIIDKWWDKVSNKHRHTIEVLDDNIEELKKEISK